MLEMNWESDTGFSKTGPSKQMAKGSCDLQLNPNCRVDTLMRRGSPDPTQSPRRIITEETENSRFDNKPQSAAAVLDQNQQLVFVVSNPNDYVAEFVLTANLLMIFEESLLIIRDLGIQTRTTNMWGISKTRFIPTTKVLEVIINEAVTKYQIKYYMALIVEGEREMVVVFEEVDKIATAMKDAKFRELLSDYVKEISDPNNRELYESEISALEADRGNDIRWVKPTPGRVIKTEFAAKPNSRKAGKKSAGSSDVIPDGITKVFINLCTCAEIEEARAGEVDEARSGRSWSIPYSLTPGRVDMDKGTKNVKMAYKGEIKSTVIRTKTDKLTRSSTTTSLDFVENLYSQQQQHQKSSGSAQPCVPQPAEPAHPHASKTVISGNRNSSAPPLIQELPPHYSSKETVCLHTAQVPEVPEYTLTHRTSPTYQSYLSTRTRTHAHPSRPHALVLRVRLPRCSTAADVCATVCNDGLVCRVVAGPSLYAVDVPLPFTVVEADAQARFFAAKRVLEVVLPCVPAPVQEDDLLLPDESVPLESDEETKHCKAKDDEPESTLAEQDHVNAAADALASEKREHCGSLDEVPHSAALSQQSCQTSETCCTSETVPESNKDLKQSKEKAEELIAVIVEKELVCEQKNSEQQQCCVSPNAGSNSSPRDLANICTTSEPRVEIDASEKNQCTKNITENSDDMGACRKTEHSPTKRETKDIPLLSRFIFDIDD
ncbi:Protein kintoun [Entophlyctis luteolus]|nr:Protein kintoun [Entophlyctis luteolus]